MMLQSIVPLLTTLKSTKDAVVRVGAVLIVKVDWKVLVSQLTFAQQLELERHPELMASPHELLQAVGLATDGGESDAQSTHSIGEPDPGSTDTDG